MIKKIEFFLKFLPIIFGVLTILGYIYLQSYYYFFDIDIINYLDLSEIPLLFFQKSIIIALIILVVLFYSYYLKYKLLIEISNSVEISDKLNKKQKTNKKLQRLLGILSIVSIFMVIIGNLIRKNYIGLIYPVSLLIVLFFLNIIYENIFKPYSAKLNIFSIFSAGFSFLILNLYCVFIITDNLEKGYHLRYDYYDSKSISFTYNDKIFNTDSNTVYIGQTKNNLFLFDRKKDEVLILDIKKVDYLKNILK